MYIRGGRTELRQEFLPEKSPYKFLAIVCAVLLSSRVTQDIRGDLPKETGVGRGREAAQEAGEVGPGTRKATAKGDRTQEEGGS